MVQRILDPTATAAVLLGASDWTECGLGLAPSFRRSSKGFLRYLVDSAGLGLDQELVLDLFDDPSSAGEQLSRLRDELDGLLKERRETGCPIADIVIFYVGHGTTDDQGQLTLLVRRSRKGLETETGIKAPDLARVLRISAPHQRRLVVLDCCFAEAATRAFIGMGAFDQAVVSIAAKEIGESLPSRGGLLLCSSQIGAISVGPPNAAQTLFSSAILNTLRKGVESGSPYLSFSDLCEGAYSCMLTDFGAKSPRPVLHPINQTHGDLSRAPAFPNFRKREDSRLDETSSPVRDASGHSAKTSAPSLPGPFFAEETPSDTTTTTNEVQIQKRLRLISRWYAEEIIPQNDIDFVISTALGERDDRAASLVRRVLDSPNATASSLMAVLLGVGDSTILRRRSPVGIVEHAPERTPSQVNKVLLVSNANVQKPPTDLKKAIAASGRLGKYELRSVIARSAMSLVYDGWDPSIQRRVAIKVIHQASDPSDSEGDEQRGRFQREAQTAGGLIHPNIVGVYDYGETEELAYIVMEFVDGRSLKQLLDSGRRLELDDVRRIMSDVLTGLQYSHEKGVVHRDIKPSNVMLTASGTAKITDFGIARFERNEMTQAGMVIGTPAYMSPEQFLGERVDVRSDIYSTGVMLFQLLTGERPFDGNLATIMHKVLYGTPLLPSSVSRSVTPSMDSIVGKAMARKPEDRYSSANEFSEALEAAFGDTMSTARTPRIHAVGEKAKRLPVSGGNAAFGLPLYVKASLVVVIAAAVAAILSLRP